MKLLLTSAGSKNASIHDTLLDLLVAEAYAIDDETAIGVAAGVVEVVSEGQWKLFDASP